MSKYHRIYIGNLPSKVRKSELKKVFEEIGAIESVSIDEEMNHAYLEYEHSRSAEEAVKKLDGRKIDGSRITVEYADVDFNRKVKRVQQRDFLISKGMCFHCKEKGHVFKECPTRVKKQSQTRRSRSRKQESPRKSSSQQSSRKSPRPVPSDSSSS